MIQAGWKDLFAQLLQQDRVMLLAHRGPDADTLGSCFALKHLLERAGRQVFVACSDEVPQRLQFVTDGAAELPMLFEPQTVVSLDVAEPKLLGSAYESWATRVDFCIDHHATNTAYAAQTICDGACSSTGELLYQLIVECGLELDTYLAEKLYVAISSDTGCFKYSNTRPSTHLAAAQLLRYSIDAAQINRNLFDCAPLSRIQLEGIAAQRLEVHCNGRVSVLCVTQDMIRPLGLDDDSMDGLSSVARRVQGTQASITLRQLSDGEIRVSLRSEGDLNVAQVAGVFGGGGHARAAGCSFTGDLQQAKQSLLKVIEEALDDHTDR